MQGVISPVSSSTECCAGIVWVLKKNGKVWICVDLTEPNKALKRECHPMPSVYESLAKIGNSKIFSTFDANSEFLQIPLDEESRLLTTFVKPFGWYCFNRVLLGISSTPDTLFQTPWGPGRYILTNGLCSYSWLWSITAWQTPDGRSSPPIGT